MPHLDYGKQLWSPSYKTDILINLLELVQRKMTKMIHGLRNLPYQDGLKCLKLHLPKRRKLRGDLIETFKWVMGYNIGDVDNLLMINQQGITRSNEFKLEKI